MTPEGKVKAKVKRILKKYGKEIYQFWPVQTGYGASTLDVLCCVKGKFLAIETKAEGKKPTQRQELTIKDIKAAEGIVLVIDGTNYEVLEDILCLLLKIQT